MKGVFAPTSLSGTGTPVNDIDEEIERLFVLDYSPMHRSVPEAQVVTYSVDKQVSQLQIRHPRTQAIEVDRMSLVVSIDGACRDSGKPTARASWLSTSAQAPDSTLAAVDAIRGISHGDMTLQEIKIRSDSEYLCQAMSMWVTKWIEDDGLRPNGQPVAHFAKLKEIHEAIGEMTYGDDGGLQFQFWHVPRGANREADALANSALDN